MKDSLERFVALYGAPVAVTVEVVCSDGTKRPTEEYKEYQKMMEEWETNKPALDEEINKILENRFKELEQQLKQCRESAASNEP
jgi:transketolase